MQGLAQPEEREGNAVARLKHLGTIWRDRRRSRAGCGDELRQSEVAFLCELDMEATTLVDSCLRLPQELVHPADPLDERFVQAQAVVVQANVRRLAKGEDPLRPNVEQVALDSLPPNREGARRCPLVLHP